MHPEGFLTLSKRGRGSVMARYYLKRSQTSPLMKFKIEGSHITLVVSQTFNAVFPEALS